MSTELLIEREEDRVDYLIERTKFGTQYGVTFRKEQHSKFTAKVLRFTSNAGTEAPITLTIDSGIFSSHVSISIAEARLYALALNAACDEAELAAAAEDLRSAA